MTKYEDIQAYVKREYGFTPQTCWIAHMKEICGIPVRPAHNRRSAASREKPCPPEKMEAIRSAFIHFKIYFGDRVIVKF